MNDQNRDYLNKHIDILSFRDLTPGTVATYSTYMTKYIDWTESELSQKPLCDVTWEEIRVYLRHLKENRGLNPRTINGHIAQLRDFYLYVLHREWDRYQVPYMKFDEELPKVPTKAEVNAIIDSIGNPKHKAQIALLYSSGIRPGELVSLKCRNIWHSKGHISIETAKNRSGRNAVLSEKAYGVLAGYIRSSYRGATKDSWLFPGQEEGSHISTESVRLTFKRHLAKTGLSESGYTLRSLRHAFGLHLYESGAGIMEIKEAMGHKSISSTTVYLTLGIGNGRSVKSPYDD